VAEKNPGANATGLALPQIGETVLYVPCAQTHWNDLDHRGERLFNFVFEDGPVLRSTGRKPARGEPVVDFRELGALQQYDPKRGVVLTASEHTIRPVGAKAAWPGTVVTHVFREELRAAVVKIDGQEQEVMTRVRDERLALEVRHPNGFLTLYYPLEGQAALAHGTGGHNWYRAEEVD
jgi:hypothetical protein